MGPERKRQYQGSQPLLLPVDSYAKLDPDRALLWSDSPVGKALLGEDVLFIRLAPGTMAESFQHFFKFPILLQFS